jgi:hypothetical protein
MYSGRPCGLAREPPETLNVEMIGTTLTIQHALD